MEEGQLHLTIAILLLNKEHHSALVEATVHSLYELATSEDALVVPLNF